MAKNDTKQPPELKVYEEPLENGAVVTIQETGPNSLIWKVIDFQGVNLKKLSKALFKILRSKKECQTICVGSARLTTGLTKDEILQQLAKEISEDELRKIFLS